jgi:hypothetical protein
MADRIAAAKGNDAGSLGDLASQMVPLIEANTESLPVLDYAAGALLSLQEAERHGFKDRPVPCEPNYVDQVATAVKEMHDGKMPHADFWVAGWNFNSALIRIVASYDRALRIFTAAHRRHGGSAVVHHSHEKIDKIRNEVNSLKHDGPGNIPNREVQFAEAVKGLQELLDFIAEQRPLGV